MPIAHMGDPGMMTRARAHGADGDKPGRIDAIHYDNEPNTPEWGRPAAQAHRHRR